MVSRKEQPMSSEDKPKGSVWETLEHHIQQVRGEAHSQAERVNKLRDNLVGAEPPSNSEVEPTPDTVTGRIRRALSGIQNSLSMISTDISAME